MCYPDATEWPYHVTCSFCLATGPTGCITLCSLVLHLYHSNVADMLCICFSGHSLGGALAHLYSGTLLLAKQPNGRPTYSAAVNFEAVYTFGEPRVGDQVWVENVEDALRTVACGDFKAEDRWAFDCAALNWANAVRSSSI